MSYSTGDLIGPILPAHYLDDTVSDYTRLHTERRPFNLTPDLQMGPLMIGTLCAVSMIHFVSRVLTVAQSCGPVRIKQQISER